MNDPSDRIPVTKLSNEDVWRAVVPRLEALVLEGRFILGAELEDFERAAADCFDARWCVGTSSGTSALLLALRALELPQGARVAIPANTFFATFEAVIIAGLRPVVFDHDADHLIDLDALETADVEAVIPVHLYGLPVDMPRLMDLAGAKGWRVIEDCAQAHGATIGGRSVGSFGDVGAFSAYPTKNLGAWGDAGFVVGKDGAVENRIRALRHHGQIRPNEHDLIGGTHRLDNLQALVLTEKLRHLPEEVEARRKIAEWYREELSEAISGLPRDKGSRRHVYHQFVVRVGRREEVQRLMADRLIGTSVHYRTPVHEQVASKNLFDTHGVIQRGQTWPKQILSLPMFRDLSRDDVRRIAHALIDALGA